MHVNTQIRRGLERCIASNEAARVAGLYGLAGFENVETFNGLEGVMRDAGVPGTTDQMKLIRRRHGVLCERMQAAVPVAKRAMELMDENNGNLSGIFSKVGKALKKVAKVAVKLSPSHALIKKVPALKKISPAFRVAEGTTPLIAAAVGPPPPTDPAVAAEAARIKAQAKADKQAAKAKAKADKAAAKQAKKDAKAAAALARANVKSGTPTVDAGAAVLANQTGVNLTTEQAAALAQQVAANIQQPGSTVPTASMFSPSAADAAPAAADSAGPFGLPMPVVLGGVALVAGGLFLAMRKKR